MELTFVGAGSAFNTVDFQSNMLLKGKSRTMLIDIGSFGPIALEKLGITSGNVHEKIDDVFITHLHGDHVHGMEWLAFVTKFNPAAGKLNLYAIQEVMKNMWDHTLKGGLESIQREICSLTTYFECFPLEKSRFLEWDGIKIMPIQTIHIQAGYQYMECYGMMLHIARGPLKTDRKILISGDTQFDPVQFRELYAEADLIFHDCETGPYPSGVHAHYDQLNGLDPETKKKMWLYHYQPNPTQDPISDGFLGFVQAGQSFDLNPASPFVESPIPVDASDEELQEVADNLTDCGEDNM